MSDGSSTYIRVTRRDDGLWLEFTMAASVKVEAILDGRGPIVSRIIRQTCDALAVDKTSERSEIEYQALQAIGEA